MKTIRQILLLAVAAIALLSCTKEKHPEVTDHEFAVRLSETEHHGHYNFALEIFKGSLFTAPLTLEVKMNGATGDLKVNGQTYTPPVTFSENKIPISYLPYSTGNHLITLSVTGGGITQTAQLEIGGVTALPTNLIILPYQAERFNPNLGENLFSADETYFKVIPGKWNGRVAAHLKWLAEGESFVYQTQNGVTTGAKVISAALIPLQGFIIEVNGVRCDNTKGITEVENRRTNINTYNTIKIIGRIPENASNYNPILSANIFYNAQYVISKKVLSDVQNKSFEFHNTSNQTDGCDGFITVFDEEGKIIYDFPMWKWKDK